MALKPKKSQTPAAPPAAVAPTAPPAWLNGGYCWALCNLPGTKAKPIAEDRSSILYVIDLTSSTPTVIDLFQHHSCEYAPRYITQRNSTPQHCIDQYDKTLQGLISKGIVIGNKGKNYDFGILTGNTAEILDLIEKCYQISQTAANTIARIRNCHARSTPTPIINPVGINISTIDIFSYLYRYVEDYKYNCKHKTDTKFVVSTHSTDQYILRFIGDPIKYILPKALFLKAQSVKSPKLVTARLLANTIAGATITF